MANIMTFKEGDTLIGQGEEDTIAYLIKSGWVKVRRKQRDGGVMFITLQAGEIIGELGLAEFSHHRTATVITLTDDEVEVIDRGALIRLVNGPGNRLTPLLAALFSRLQRVSTRSPLAIRSALSNSACRCWCSSQSLFSPLS